MRAVCTVSLVTILTLASGNQRPVSAADGFGSLLVESDPAGALVYVDGRRAGETPLTLTMIATGVHRVRLVRLGYLENSRLVTIKTGAHVTLRARLTDPAPQAPRMAALKIVVLEGEGAVNIIQQKTAVAPVVEVRDHNDQPVSGAVVRFVIQKGRASFDGARTLTVTTNAAGRATATGLTATGRGALQIAASAAFQGQTAAISIAQTTVVTTAEAASIASGSGAGSAGGGLSHFAIAGIVGGAGAGITGALLASKGPSIAVTAASGTYTLQSVGGSPLPVILFPECQLGGPPPCAPCIHAAVSGTISLTTSPEKYTITLVTGATNIDPQGVSPTSTKTLPSSESGTWSARPDGSITFAQGNIFNLGVGMQSGSALSIPLDWLSNAMGVPPMRVVTGWSK